MHDLVIRNARIADGLGSPLRDGDLAVDGGRVSVIGSVAGAAGETVDAGGKVLAPGVIDLHHPLRCTASLGFDRVAVSRPRGDDRRHRQLWLRHRAGAAGASRHDPRESRRGRRHVARVARGGGRLDLRDVRRVPRCLTQEGGVSECRRPRLARNDPHRGDGRRGFPPGSDAGGARAYGRNAARRNGRRRSRFWLVHQ